MQERLTLEDNRRKKFLKKILFIKKTEVVAIRNEQKNPIKNIVHIQSSMEKLIFCWEDKDAKRTTSWVILVELFLVHSRDLFENCLIY